MYNRTPSYSPVIGRCEAWQLIGFNKDGTQLRLFSAYSLPLLLKGWAKEIEKHEKYPQCNILTIFNKIVVWNVDEGFTGLELPYIETIKV